MKAFDELKKREGNSGGMDYSQALRASCVGVIKMFVNGDCGSDDVRAAISILDEDKSSEARSITSIIKKWSSEVNLYF